MNHLKILHYCGMTALNTQCDLYILSVSQYIIIFFYMNEHEQLSICFLLLFFSVVLILLLLILFNQ